MRTQILSAIAKLMQNDPDIYFLTGDLGFHALEEIQSQFPDRFLNCGIAEQNMIGFASGLALTGKKVYVYSIIPFLTMRCFEQIRNDICLHNLPVTLLGVGSGLTYGVLGNSHYALEDIGILSTLPNMRIISPCDGVEGELLIPKLYQTPSPTYIRLGKAKQNLTDPNSDFDLSKPRLVRDGSDITILATGDIISIAIETARHLETQGISTQVVHVFSLKPIDPDSLLPYCQNKKYVFTLDEHFQAGGLNSLIASIFVQHKNLPILKGFFVPQQFSSTIGSHDFMRQKHGLTAPQISASIKQIYEA